MGRPSKGVRLERRAENGIYYIVWPGTRRGNSTNTSDRAVAESLLGEFLVERDRVDQRSGKTHLSVSAVLDIYLDEHIRPRKKKAGRVVVRAEIAENAADYLKGHFGDKLVSEIVDDDITHGKTGYIHRREAGELKCRDTSPFRTAVGSTIRRELGVLIAALVHCSTKKDPTSGRLRLSKDDVPFIPLPDASPAEDRWLTYAEEQTLRAAAPAAEPPARLSRIHRFLTLALEDGARKEAIEELSWFQVNFEAGTVDYRKPGVAVTNKKKAKVRMTAASRAMLERAYKEKTSEWVLDHPGAIRTSFENLTERAGLEGVTPHTLRHTWATRASQNRVSMEEIAVQLADNLQTIIKNYWHHHPDALQDAANWRDRETAKKEAGR